MMARSMEHRRDVPGGDIRACTAGGRVEGRSQRAVARDFGLSRETVRKMLQYAVPPGYQRQQPIKRPKLGPWVGLIDAILEDDK